eukprot:1837661-Rhodomonas_salina.1
MLRETTPSALRQRKSTGVCAPPANSTHAAWSRRSSAPGAQLTSMEDMHRGAAHTGGADGGGEGRQTRVTVAEGERAQAGGQPLHLAYGLVWPDRCVLSSLSTRGREEDGAKAQTRLVQDGPQEGRKERKERQERMALHKAVSEDGPQGRRGKRGKSALVCRRQRGKRDDRVKAAQKGRAWYCLQGRTDDRRKDSTCAHGTACKERNESAAQYARKSEMM